MPSTLVVSLDFELLWGRYDRLASCSSAEVEQVQRTPRVVEQLLAEFSARSIKATWATVTAISCDSWREFSHWAPPSPAYCDRRFVLSPGLRSLFPGGVGFFDPQIVERILRTPGQELGTHTFCHSFFGEEGASAKDLSDDLESVRQISLAKHGKAPASLVYPRNQCRYPEILPDTTIRIWRGTEKPWYFRHNRSRGPARALIRGLRFTDSVAPWIRRSSALEGNMTRASLFLRLNSPMPLWRMQLQRIDAELRQAPDHHIFHLWFHPENVEAAGAEGLHRVREVIALLSRLIESGTAQSLAMGDLIDRQDAPH